ncbi:MAG: hypothetical protein ABSG43_09680 [Solirubrobacteraceae bacterium]
MTGTNLTGATAVRFGTTAATNVTVLSPTGGHGDPPPASGTVDVTVTTAGGTSATSSADQLVQLSSRPSERERAAVDPGSPVGARHEPAP